jgi:cysteine sulfinate desulfinase/cysteine desulfurase-like protein
MSTVRFSVGRFTTSRDVEEGARRVLAAARSLASS